ncbi:MAG: tetratricopeptide repeat protein, partial [Verrucomicrobiota bacterium]
MGLWHFRRGEFTEAENHFRRAIERLTRRNANPRDGEAFYNLGVCLRYLNRDTEAYDALSKAVWNQAWVAAGRHALAEIDCARKNWTAAGEHLSQSLRHDTDNLRARNLLVMVSRMLGREEEAGSILRETLALDPLDWWARMLKPEPLGCDLQTRLDIAHDLARAGFVTLAIAALKTGPAPDGDLPTQNLGAAPLVEYTLGWLWEKQGGGKTAARHFRRAAALSPDYCFPSRLEEIAVFETAMRANPRDARARYYLGNLLYDRRRHDEAIRLWEKSARLDPGYSVVWRNLGIGCFNLRHDAARARAHYDRAFRLNPADARLLHERDQLWKRLGETPGRRLRDLNKHPALVARRDDLSVELCALLNQTGRPVQATQLLAQRCFQPWEGGEGAALGQHVRAQLSLGRQALACQDYPRALSHFENALHPPKNLGETWHPLANQSDVLHWLGCAAAAMGEKKKARGHWLAAANSKGDFQEMRARPFSEMTYYSALAMERLGQKGKARKLLGNLLSHAVALAKTPAKIDYFATSLPTMPLFEDDLEFRRRTTAMFLQAQAHIGLGRKGKGRALLEAVLRRDPNHAPAWDLRAEMDNPPNARR